jgi:hypothetical protein
VGLQDQTVSIGVNHHLALATCDLLARIIASRATAIGGLHALAVEYTGGGGRLPPNPLAIRHDQRVVDGLKQASIPPQAEPAKDRALGWQVGR